MNTSVAGYHRRTVTGARSIVIRLLDMALVVMGAMMASRVQSQDLFASRVDIAFVTFAAAITAVLFPVFNVYQSWRGRSTWILVGQTSLAWLVVQGCGLALMFALHQTDLVSRLWFAYWTGIAGGAMLALRIAMHVVLSQLRYAGINLRHVAIIGCGANCESVVEAIASSPASGFRPVAVFDIKSEAIRHRASVQTFDDLDRFVAFVRSQEIKEVWVSLPLSEQQAISRIVAAFRDDLVNVRFMPDMRSVALFESNMIELLGMPAINLVASPLPAHGLIQKDLFDRVFAAAALLALLPLIVLIALAVKCSSPGPVFFTQRRKGADGRIFRIYKFRSMYVHSDKPGVVRQATRGDARITRIGSLLRRTSLDELPQFINVLRGDMSVVGPRPHAIEHDELYQNVVSGYIHRYRIKPGITGWAQVNGFRGETDCVEKMQRRVECDLYYLRNWSFGFDMRIVAATISRGLVHHNAY